MLLMKLNPRVGVSLKRQLGRGPITRRYFLCTLVHHRAETLRAENIGALSDPNRQLKLTYKITTHTYTQ